MVFFVERALLSGKPGEGRPKNATFWWEKPVSYTNVVFLGVVLPSDVWLEKNCRE